MSKILLTLKGQPDNMGAKQLFDNQDHFNDWIKQHSEETHLLPNVKIDKKTLTFGIKDEKGNWSGSGIIENKPDDFKN